MNKLTRTIAGRLSQRSPSCRRRRQRGRSRTRSRAIRPYLCRPGAKGETHVESLIDARQKCYDQAVASVQAGQQKNLLECPVLDEMIAQTPLETLVGQPLRGIEARVPQEEVLKLKRAIVDAAYFGYQRGKWKNAKY